MEFPVAPGDVIVTDFVIGRILVKGIWVEIHFIEYADGTQAVIGKGFTGQGGFLGSLDLIPRQRPPQAQPEVAPPKPDQN